MEYFRKNMRSLYLRGFKTCNGNAVSVAVQLRFEHFTTVRMRSRAEGQRVRDQQATPDTIVAVTETSTRTKTQQYPLPYSVYSRQPTHTSLSAVLKDHITRGSLDNTYFVRTVLFFCGGILVTY